MISRLSDRRCEVGLSCWQLVESTYDLELDFHYRVFNPYGHETRKLGDSVRCFFLGYSDKKFNKKCKV
ncbi:hypothetical protein A35E_00011 [secondary endosymbiont of Heteropsylla cubana]|uniref:Uncharacterized protein n=1 Tax=secondary endosymbiont of Heteropsylla cubana TaxID=134287 RepID=J3TG47_9ENTR|nr:hypothetical protein [secondary endosymbiont of Heteropsylla cubana]AFP85337.1 hypothetical protein A35E_00011 [secondary endosymbiont of Heteropsylla cubana]